MNNLDEKLILYLFNVFTRRYIVQVQFTCTYVALQ